MQLALGLGLAAAAVLLIHAAISGKGVASILQGAVSKSGSSTQVALTDLGRTAPAAS